MTQDCVLLVASTDKGLALLQMLVSGGRYPVVRICRSGAEARRERLADDVSMVLINAPLSDETGLELAVDFAQASVAGVMLLVKADLVDPVTARVEERGVLVIGKPVIRQIFDQALRFAIASHHRMALLKAEKERLERRLSEQQLIDRAKCVLIQYLNMTEEQAHRYIEKHAMDTRQTRVNIAQTILSTYEL